MCVSRVFDFDTERKSGFPAQRTPNQLHEGKTHTHTDSKKSLGVEDSNKPHIIQIQNTIVIEGSWLNDKIDSFGSKVFFCQDVIVAQNVSRYYVSVGQINEF